MNINKLISKYNHNISTENRIKYIVIHYVGGLGGAEQNCKYFAECDRGASAHYFVGFNGEIWQCVEDKDVAWHCGANSYKHAECRNVNSIGIEMCVRKKNTSSMSVTDKDWYFEDATVKATTDLTKYLMGKYNVPESNVIRHYDVTGKICPNPYVYNTTNHTWDEFKNMITEIQNSQEKKEMAHEEFIEFVGNIAVKDWKERRIMLPSIIIAQAIKESAWGESELAKNANALFGLKQNGWEGKVYYKDATEQNPDGSYRKDEDVAWRAYESWEQSVIDHNNYIAERKVGNQEEPNFKEVIGEIVLKRAIAGLVGDGYRYESAKECTDLELKKYVEEGNTLFPYATSHTYPQSLLTDYIEKYNLTKYDNVEANTGNENEEYAPEGSLFIVQVGAYRSLKNAERFQKHLEDIGVISIISQYKIG